jgi:outer membrane protein TolC
MVVRIAFLILSSLAVVPATGIAAPAGKEPEQPTSDRIRELQKERVKALQEQLRDQLERVNIGKDPLIQFIEAVRELGDAELDLANSREGRLAAVERVVKSLKEGEEAIDTLLRAGLQTRGGLAQIKAARLKAEIQFERLKLSK